MMSHSVQSFPQTEAEERITLPSIWFGRFQVFMRNTEIYASSHVGMGEKADESGSLLSLLTIEVKKMHMKLLVLS